MIDHSILTVTKRSAARAEIDGAIRALADHQNFLAAELLASAAIDVITGVERASNLPLILDEFEDRVKPEHRKEVRKILKQTYNFLKHSDRDRNSAIDRYATNSAVWKLFIAILDYEKVCHCKSLEMGFYFVWFFSRYPNVLLEKHRELTAGFNNMYGSLENSSEQVALEALKNVFEQFDQFRPDVYAQQVKLGLANVEI